MVKKWLGYTFLNLIKALHVIMALPGVEWFIKPNNVRCGFKK